MIIQCRFYKTCTTDNKRCVSPC